MPSAAPLIVASRTDPASLNIARCLIHQKGYAKSETPGPWEMYRNENRSVNLAILEKELIHVQPQDLPGDARSIIFVSKHRSSTETPALTVHATGNLTSEALYGGGPEEVSMVEPFRVQTALSTISREVNRLKLGIEVTMEATHHGPTNLPAPVCFVEIGSGPDQWQDPVLGGVVAEAAIAAAAPSSEPGANAVGFGGTHYPARHTKVCIEGTYRIGHVVSRYALEAGVSDQLLLSTFKKTLDSCRTAILDWKGLKGEQRRRLQDILPSWDVEPVRK